MSHEHLTGQADRDASTPAGGPIPAGVDGFHIGRDLTPPPALVAEFPAELARIAALAATDPAVRIAALERQVARLQDINDRLIRRLPTLRRQVREARA